MYFVELCTTKSAQESAAAGRRRERIVNGTIAPWLCATSLHRVDVDDAHQRLVGDSNQTSWSPESSPIDCVHVAGINRCERHA